MTSIDLVSTISTPPVSLAAAPAVAAAAQSDQTVSTVTVETNAAPTNANVSVPATYTALANASVPNIRGLGVDTAA